jgi:hypothetical protein
MEQPAVMLPILPMSISAGIEREMAGISTMSAMAANANHATNLCCAARFNTRKP